MERNDFIEQIIGGVFAIIAIGAAIAELMLGDISYDSIAGCIKDIFGTLVVVILFFTVIKDGLQNIFCSFTKKIQKDFDKWIEENASMIVKDPKFDTENCYGLGLRTNMKFFYSSTPNDTASNTGLFVRVPKFDKHEYSKEKVEISFHLNRGTFFEGRNDLSEEQKKNGFEHIAGLIVNYISSEKIIKSIKHSANKDSATITVLLKGPIKRNDIRSLVNLIDKTYKGYLVAANLKV